MVVFKMLTGQDFPFKKETLFMWSRKWSNYTICKNAVQGYTVYRYRNSLTGPRIETPIIVE